MTAPARPLWQVTAAAPIPPPSKPSPHDISVVVPVRNNLVGVRRLLASIAAGHALPREVIVVDNRSDPPLVLHGAPPALKVRLLFAAKPGPAAARNVGAAAATGNWLLFLDSDCEVAPDCIDQWQHVPEGAVGYAGSIVAAHPDRWSTYYQRQEILRPQATADGSPAYLITAHCLISREALAHLGGFDECFPLAAGEDIDLSLRLRSVGRLVAWDGAVVFHDFDPGLVSFIRRFCRYGAGNWLIHDKYGYDLAPKPFAPNSPGWFPTVAALTQFYALSLGYWTARVTDTFTGLKQQHD